MSRGAVSRCGAADPAVWSGLPARACGMPGTPSGNGQPSDPVSMHLIVTDQRPDCETANGDHWPPLAVGPMVFASGSVYGHRGLAFDASGHRSLGGTLAWSAWSAWCARRMAAARWLRVLAAMAAAMGIGVVEEMGHQPW